MMRQKQVNSPFGSHSSLTLLMCLLSVGVASIKPAGAFSSRPNLDAAHLGQRQVLLAQIPQEAQVSQQVKAEVDRTLSRMATLFNILLGTLVVLLALAIATLWIMRRAVIQEIATRVKA
ncbi:MAG: hypothetical protein VKJ46_11130, partial [Leptolyngbyaceae bacterium]|nr:hypothetical protein [Leptolyngbyaceae bacterium]